MAWCCQATSHLVSQCWTTVYIAIWCYYAIKVRNFMYIFSNTDSNPLLLCHLHTLTHLTEVPHIRVSELGQHWFRYWLVAYSTPSHYSNQCWVNVNQTLRNKLRWNFDQNKKKHFTRKNGFKKIVCEMVVILPRRRWVDTTPERTPFRWHFQHFHGDSR